MTKAVAIGIVVALFELGMKIAKEFEMTNDEIRAELKVKMSKESAVAEAFKWYEDMLQNSSGR